MNFNKWTLGLAAVGIVNLSTAIPRRSMFGVDFTEEQWQAAHTEPPLWHLNPPQREEYADDATYAHGMRDYADRVLKEKS